MILVQAPHLHSPLPPPPSLFLVLDWGGLSCVNICVCAGIVGEIDEGGDGYYIWTHKKFDIGYNGKQIVDVNLTSESKVKLEPNIKISFSYEVSKIGVSVSLCSYCDHVCCLL